MNHSLLAAVEETRSFVVLRTIKRRTRWLHVRGR